MPSGPKKQMEINAIFENENTCLGKHSIFYASSTHSDSGLNKNPQNRQFRSTTIYKAASQGSEGCTLSEEMHLFLWTQRRSIREFTVEAHRCREGSAWGWLLSREVLRGQPVSPLRFWGIPASGLWETHQNYQWHSSKDHSAGLVPEAYGVAPNQGHQVSKARSPNSWVYKTKHITYSVSSMFQNITHPYQNNSCRLLLWAESCVPSFPMLLES